MGFAEDFGTLDPGAQAQILKQYGSVAAARAALEAPAPPPVGAPVAPPPPPAAPLPTPKPSNGMLWDGLNSYVAAAHKAAEAKAAGHALPTSEDPIAVGLRSAVAPVDPFPNGPAPAATAAATTPEIGNRYAKGAGDAAAPSTTPGISWGGALGGGGVVAAHEQQLTTKAREDELLGGIDKEAAAIEGQKTAVGVSADANAEIEKSRAIGLQDIAKATEDAGVDAKLRAQQRADESKAYRARIDSFAAKLATDKIDPQRMWNSASTGTQITWTLAKAFGAIGQAFLHTPTNQIADHIEQMAANDVAAQKANHEIGREHLSDMKTMYGEALRETGNAEEAERVATGYALEAAKQQAQALTVNAQSKAQKAKGEEVIAQLSERQAMIGQKRAETEIKLNPMVQAHAGASAGGPTYKELVSIATKWGAEQRAAGYNVTPDDEKRYALAITGKDPFPGRPFPGGAKADPANKDLHEAQVAADEFNRQIENLKRHPVVTGAGLGTALGAHLPQRVAPGSNDAQQQLNGINTQMLQAIGKVAKDADGKPNKAMIEEIQRQFEMHLSDTPAIRQQKINGVANVYNALAREQGAKAPEPNKGPPPGMAP